MFDRERLLSVLVFFYGAALVAALVVIYSGRSEKPGRASASHGVLAIVTIEGPIRTEIRSSPWGSDDADDVARRLHRISENDRVKAVLLRINSPGGTVGATQEIHAEILRCKAKGKKVVASLGDVAASGGYYLASAADRIVADPGTITGSIGVILQFGNLEGLFQKFGVRLDVIKSGAHKDMGNPARSLTPEERAMLQASIDDAYDQFLAAVATGRKLPVAKIKPLADGRIFTGRQALGAGLVDELGGRQEAIASAIKLAGLPEHPFILTENSRSFSTLIHRLGSRSRVALWGWPVSQDEAAGPLMEYRWR